MRKDKRKIAVIGGGPAGMLAAYAASQNKECDITLYERNEKLGKKLFITGKGRCNVTNDCSAENFFTNVISNPKFLYSAYYFFDNSMLMKLIEDYGTPLKVERGNRVFPQSEKSSDIIRTFEKMLDRDNIHLRFDCKIDEIKKDSKKFVLDGIRYDRLILAGGGKSYPATGSDGSAFKLAGMLGHKVIKTRAGLCGVEISDIDTRKLSGLSLRNIRLIVEKDRKKLFDELGEMEFTHFGISGPLVLTISSLFEEDTYNSLKLFINLKPGLSEDMLNKRIIREIEDNSNKDVGNTLNKLLPERLMEAIYKRAGVDSKKKSNQITKQERCAIIDSIMKFEINPIKLRPIEYAIITRGGVSCAEINPSTMESKIVDGLYFAGEMIDVDALTGGYNLQIAFSTGYLAGMSAADETKE